MTKNITMRDIAEKLNVSSVTVSKALNDKEGVSEELREKIKEVADEMGYRINAAAKAMRDGNSYNIGVIIPERFTGLAQSFYLQMYQYISIALEKYNYSGIMHLLTSDDEENNRLPKIYYEKKVDGFIVLGQTNKNYLKTIKNANIPIVFLDFYDEFDDVDSVITDNFFGAYELTNYLIRKGHKKIGFIGNLYSTSSIQDRFLGYYKSLLEHHIKIDQNTIVDDRDEQGSYIEIELPEKLPSAFVCNCDQVAHHLIRKLNETGYSVPEDCSVVGFDNDIYATITEPNLTTVEVDIEEMANTAVRFIVEKLKDSTVNYGRVSVKGNIIYRDSVKAR
jgi:LacI family transcriptional regulator